MGLSRRTFLGLTGAAAGLALVRQDLEELYAAVAGGGRDWPGPGVETWATSVCQLCPGGCGIRVRLLDGWPVRVAGNPEHPLNRGGLCPKGAAALQAFYDPDRIRRPLLRAGGRGEDGWREVGWDEALGLLAARLAALREQGRPERLLLIGGQVRGLTRELWDRFLAAFGSPNDVTTALGCEASDTVLRLTQGMPGHIGYDLERANYVLSFGVSLLEGSWSPVWQMRAYAELRQGRPGHRGKLVQIDPRFSVTAAKADEWIPLRPGTDLVLALGIAHVLVRDGLYDRAFVEARTRGLEDGRDAAGRAAPGLRTLLRDYPPAAVARQTGVPEATVVRLAREFGETRPAIALGDRGASRYPDGLLARWAVHCLNALGGSLEVSGGVLAPPPVPLAPLPPLAPDPLALRGRARPRLDGAGGAEAPLAASAIHRLPDALRTGRPYPAEIACLYFANPTFSVSASLRMREALDRVPFVVSFSPYPDESTAVADLVLPDHTFLERWEDDPTRRNVGFPVLGLRQPVRAPLYDTRATADVLLALAAALGGPLARAFPWRDTPAVLQARLRGLYQARAGAAAPRAVPGSFDAFWDELRARGAWWDAAYRFQNWARTLRTPSGKFEFLPEPLRAALLDARARVSVPPADGRAATGPVPGPEEFPLALITFRPLALTGGRTANLPFLLEILGKHGGTAWDTYAQVHPATAARFGVADHAWAWLESSGARIRMRVRHSPGMPRDIVAIPHGLGHQQGGRWARGRGANPNALVETTSAAVSGAPAQALGRVRLRPA